MMSIPVAGSSGSSAILPELLAQRGLRCAGGCGGPRLQPRDHILLAAQEPLGSALHIFTRHALGQLVQDEDLLRILLHLVLIHEVLEPEAVAAIVLLDVARPLAPQLLQIARADP